jgi:hypothetical protein
VSVEGVRVVHERLLEVGITRCGIVARLDSAITMKSTILGAEAEDASCFVLPPLEGTAAMNTRRKFVICAPLGFLTAAVACGDGG